MNDGVVADKRPEAKRPTPGNKLTDEEEAKILKACNEPRFSCLPPSQIVPKLLDDGEYIASESSFYRVLRKYGQSAHRGRTRKPSKVAKPTTYIATKPNQVWCWDITYLPQTTRGKYFYLYMIEDIYSRYGVAWEVHESECGGLAAKIIEKAVIRENCFSSPPVLHSDNGAPMKSVTLRAKLDALDMKCSFSRPRVSNDNPFVESLFKTLKYRPDYPVNGFSTIADARAWVQQLMTWYHQEHCHSKIGYVTPKQRHHGEDKAILSRREKVLLEAREANPSRWNGREIRNWKRPIEVALNPEKIRLNLQAA